jgi:transcriptional regulator NrdR family protein
LMYLGIVEYARESVVINGSTEIRRRRAAVHCNAARLILTELILKQVAERERLLERFRRNRILHALRMDPRGRLKVLRSIVAPS